MLKNVGKGVEFCFLLIYMKWSKVVCEEVLNLMFVIFLVFFFNIFIIRIFVFLVVCIIVCKVSVEIE